MAKLKDGFYKLTASSIGSDLLVLLAGGGAKPISDFALADGTNATGTWSINISGKSATVNCTEATSDTNRPIVVTNKSNGLYYTTKATLNYSTGNITAPTFTGALNGNADTATTASKLSTVSKKAWGLTYWTSGGIPTDISGDMTGVGNITIASNGNVDRFITFDTTSTRNWRIGYLGTGSGDANYLIFQSTKTLTAADGWHDMLKIGCETGNATFTGLLTAAKFVGPLNNTLTFSAGAFSAKTYNNSAAVTVNVPTHTSHLTNNSGFLTAHLSLANYVTLNGALTISGVKTFSTLLKFTVAEGTSPFTVTSTTKVTNLHADLLDGYNAIDIANYGASLHPYNSSATGWYKFMTVVCTTNDGMVDFIASSAECSNYGIADYFHFETRPSSPTRSFNYTHLNANNNALRNNIYAYTTDNKTYTFYMRYTSAGTWDWFCRIKLISTRGATVTLHDGGAWQTGTPSGSGYLASFTGAVAYASSAGSVAWGNVTGKPSTFTPASHTHDDRYYTESESDSRFINHTGDTMTGPLTFANGTWNVVGDDAAIGDYNAAGMLGLKSINNNIPGIGFHNSSNTLLGRLQANGSNLLWNDNKIWHAGNDGSGSGLDADTVDGVHASSLSQIKYIGNTSDFCYDVILLCKRDVAHSARLDGLLFTTGGGVCRYHCADAHFWHSCWSVGSYDTQKSISNKGYDGYGFEFCTCTYGGAVWYAIKLDRIQAVSYFFMGNWDNINWTLITYYHTSQGVKNSEIYNSISNLTSTPLRYSGSIYAHHFYESSDRLLKTNIVDINSSDNIPQLKEFDWKSDGSHSYGLIALELEEMGYHELVSNSGSHKTVNYSAALSLIVGKLQVKIKELEKEIEILKNKN